MNSTATTQDAHKRDADDGEQREAIFARAALGEADGDEAGDRHQRARQHRKRRRGVGEGRGLDLVRALLKLRDHHLDGDHRVVDQQAKRDDERAKRDALQADARAAP